MNAEAPIKSDHYVAWRVRGELAKNGKSVRQLARELGVKPGYMQRRASGRVPFRTDEIQDIAEILGVDVAALFPPTHVHQERAS